MTAGVSTQMATYNGYPSILCSAAIEPSMGTGFGQDQSFQTSSVHFEKGKIIATAEIFYDTLTQLKKQGVIVEPSRPRAFTTGVQYIPTNRA